MNTMNGRFIFSGNWNAKIYIYSASIMAWLSLPLHVCVSRKQLIFSISKPLIKKYAWLSSITLFYQCLSLFLIPRKFHSSFIILPHRNCFHHQHKMLMALWMPFSLALSLSLFVFVCVPQIGCDRKTTEHLLNKKCTLHISIHFVLPEHASSAYCYTHFLRFLVAHTNWNTFGGVFISFCPTETVPQLYTTRIRTTI